MCVLCRADQTAPTEAVTPAGQVVIVQNAHSNSKRSSVSYGHKARTIVRKGTLISLPPALSTAPDEHHDAVDECGDSLLNENVKDAVKHTVGLADPLMYIPPPFAMHKKGSVLPIISQIRRDSAALVVSMSNLNRHHSIAVPKKSISMNPGLNYGDASISAEDSREQAFLHSGDQTRRSSALAGHRDYLNGGLDGGSSVLSNSTTNSLLPQSTMLPTDELAPCADVKSNSSDAIPTVDYGPKVVVDCVVVLVESQVIIGEVAI